MRNIGKRCTIKFNNMGEYSTIDIEKNDKSIITAIIANDFLEECKKYHWQYTSAGYIRTSKKDGHILLHRMIYELYNGKIADNFQIDHINGNPLDNRLSNLRMCNRQENARNSRNRQIVKNGCIVGVKKDTRYKNLWRAQIYINKQEHIEKTYNQKKLAILQRLVWELEYFKEFAPQIEIIKSTYPYLLNYLSVRDNMKFTNDMQLLEKIGNSLKLNPHCPCIIVQNDSTLCPCLPCRDKQHCHCGMFERKEKIDS